MTGIHLQGLHLLILILCGFSLALGCGGQEPEAPSPSQPSQVGKAEEQSKPPATAKPRAPVSPELQRLRDIASIPTQEGDAAKAVAELKPLLSDSDRDVREAAILALWDVEGAESNQALAQVTRTEKDPELKTYALEELVDREAPEAVDALLSLLSDPDADVREEAAEGLESLEDPRATKGLYAAIQKEEDDWVRDAILSALSTLDPDFDEDKYE